MGSSVANSFGPASPSVSWSRLMTWSARRLSAVLSLIAVAACEPPTTTGPTGVMSDYVTSISARGGSAPG